MTDSDSDDETTVKDIQVVDEEIDNKNGCCNNYPWWVCFIIGNEFCERYAYYGMRAVLVLYLNQFIGFSKDVSTEIYHAYVAVCYFTPLIGAVVADSYWGKFKTIFILSIVYVIGMFLMAVSAINFSGDEENEEGGVENMIICIVALVVVACGTGGIKPCVSTLGGDQFPGDERGQTQLKDFFSIFYFAINAGSLCSTFITPLLRAKGDYFIAFLVPAILMLIALVLFLAGSKYYIKNMPTGNIFAQFMGASWTAFWAKIKAPKEDKREHFMDYAKDCGKYPTQIINDAKWVFPILVMYVPVPMFWALFDMQGSRWTQTATQMDGYLGTVQILPDQIQLLNALLILILLPVFQKLIYPAFEWCGIRVTPLRKMSLGQLIAGLSFVISGLVQVMIQDSLTPIPDYNKENSLMVTNAMPENIMIESPYWVNAANRPDNSSEWCDDVRCQFSLSQGTRTKTFTWFNQFNAQSNDALMIADQEFIINPAELPAAYSSGSAGSCNMKNDTYGSNTCQKCDAMTVKTQLHTITNVVYYTDGDGNANVFQFTSPKEKSGDLKIKLTYVNPTPYFMQVLTEVEGGSPSGLDEDKKVPYASPYCAMTNGGAELEPNVSKDPAKNFKFVVHLYKAADVLNGVNLTDTDEKQYEKQVRGNMGNITQVCADDADVGCYIEVKMDDALDGVDGDAKSGAMYTVMPLFDSNAKWRVITELDSKPNTVSVLWLIPQYVVITISEVLNSVTGLEFAYSQAPASMKSTVQSFWLLTTCIGNIIVIFLVSVKIGNTQAGEYFILAIIMFSAAVIFMLLSIFYYEYIDPAAFDADDDDKQSKKSKRTSKLSKSSSRDSTTSL